MFWAVCKTWRATAREFIWRDIKKLHYNSLWPDCETQGKGVKYPRDYTVSVRAFKLEYYYIPHLFVQCGRYVQDLDISKFSNSIILTKLKGCFPNLVKLSILLYKWKDEHVDGLFDGMTKLEDLNVKWNNSKSLPSTFFKALNNVVQTLKSLKIHIKSSENFNTFEYDISLSVCTYYSKLMRWLIDIKSMIHPFFILFYFIYLLICYRLLNASNHSTLLY